MRTITLEQNDIVFLIDHIDHMEVISVVEDAYTQFYAGLIDMPFPSHFEPAEGSLVHIKSAVQKGDRYVVKIASYFPQNESKGLTNLQGLVLLYDGKTGFPLAILLDNALLTHHRTAAAGAVGAEYLSRKNSTTVLIVGTGMQGKLQLDYLIHIRGIKKALIHSRDKQRVSSYIDIMQVKHPEIQFERVSDLQTACGEADIIVTATPSREPIIKASWITQGTHITAIGSDNPGKQELDPALLQKGLYVTDSTTQCAKNGELQHAIRAGIMSEEEVYAEIGAITSKNKPRRTTDTQITIFDSTGLGAQDLAIAEFIFNKRLSDIIGEILEGILEVKRESFVTQAFERWHRKRVSGGTADGEWKDSL